MSDETYRYNKGHWKLTLQDRAALLEAHAAAEAFLAGPQELDDLRRAFRHYFSYVTFLKIVADSHAAQYTLLSVDSMDGPLLCSALYRLNCQVMRYISGNSACRHHCCCGCQAGNDALACNFELTRVPPLLPLDQVN
ncbi:MAG: hypothetical protein ACYTEQ_15270 [Planctomycetota bacterium]|jgi:hypothetical protein